MSNATQIFDALFIEAVEIPSESARAEFLRQACGTDGALRLRLEALVTAHFAAGSFLNAPASAFAGSVAERMDVAETTAPKTAELGTVGSYKLLENLGEGGMGTVYVADQTHPVKRRVAVKVIKPGMDSKEVVARFEAERQALALMDHANIARVLDAGTTDAGRPYFVMELVRGLPITEYCDQARLTTDRRLRLFVRVCRAVQHAHQKGVIHRDIKPSNVMITLHDGEPVPKVIDFGIAKAVNQKLTDKTVYTALSQFVGTPMYMSPEQAELSGLDIDTRADVYSLGVLLYELLTGTTPFHPAAFRKAGLDEMRRMIREEEPARPSHRVSTLDAKDRSTVSARRGSDERQLGKSLRGDLDWIVMKALEKDRNRRYESPSSFAADIERYLSDETVAARPPSAYYQAKKFIKRNRRRMMFASVLSIGGLALIGAFLWGLYDDASRRSIADQAAAVALEDAEKFERINRWVEAKVAVDRAAGILSAVGGGTEMTVQVRDRQQLLDTILRFDDIRLEMSESKEGFRFDHARADQLYGDAFLRYGLDVDTLSPVEFAARLPKEPFRDEFVVSLDDWATTRRRGRDIHDSSWRRPLAAARAADSDPWRQRMRTTWELQRTLWVKDEEVDHWKARVAEMGGDGDFNTDAGLRELAKSAPLHRLHATTVMFLSGTLKPGDPEVLRILREAQRLRPTDFWLNYENGFRLGRELPPRHEEALGYYRAALASRPNSSIVLNNLAATLTFLGHHPDAIVIRTNLLRQFESLSGHPNLPDAVFKLGLAFESGNRTLDAITMYERALRELDARPANDSTGRNECLIALGRTYGQLARWTDSTRVLAEAIASISQIESTSVQLSDAFSVLGKNADAQKQFERAETEFRKALSIRNDQNVRDWRYFEIMSRLGEAISAQQRHEDAKLLLYNGYMGLQARAVFVPAAAKRHIAEALDRVVRYYEVTNQSERAQLWREKQTDSKRQWQ